MSSPRGGGGGGGVIEEGSDLTFPAADVEAELHLSKITSLQADSVSSQLTTSKELKEKAEAAEKKKEEEKKEDAIHKLKSAIIISGVIVAVIGAIFAVTKKLRET